MSVMYKDLLVHRGLVYNSNVEWSYLATLSIVECFCWTRTDTVTKYVSGDM